MNDVHHGVLLPTREAALTGGRPEDLIPFAREAERLGFASVWAGESLSSPRLEPLAVLGAVAGATERITLGTAALLPAAREPVGTAGALATLDRLSGGRLVVGVGAGYPGLSAPIFAAAGTPYRTRYSHLEDTVGLWRHLWSGGAGPFEGRVLRIADPPEVVGPHRTGGPPVWYAGATPTGLDRTGQHYDGWMPYPPDPADYAAGLARIRAAATAAGRGEDAVVPSLYATVLIDDGPDGGRARLARWCEAFYGRPLDLIAGIQVMITGSAGDVVQGLDRFVAAGARHIILRIGALDPAGQLERLAAALGAADRALTPH